MKAKLVKETLNENHSEQLEANFKDTVYQELLYLGFSEDDAIIAIDENDDILNELAYKNVHEPGQVRVAVNMLMQSEINGDRLFKQRWGGGGGRLAGL